MTAPTIASYLTFQDGKKSGSWFNVTTDAPLFSGTVSDAETAPASLSVYARLWTLDGKMIWHRAMTYVGLVGGAPVYEYQTAHNDVGNSEIKFFTFGTTITGGSWSFIFNSISSEAIPWGATVAQIKAAIERHPDVGVGNVGTAWDAGLRRLTVQMQARLGRMKFWSIGYTNNLTGSAAGITMSTFQDGAADFPYSTGVYQIDMVATDGTLWSGGMPGLRSALGPAPLKFYLDFTPSITSQSPANGGTVTTSTPVMSWTTIQGTLGAIPINHIRGILVDATDTLRPIVHQIDEKGANLNTFQSYQIPVTNRLINGHSYDWYVDIYKESGAVASWKNTFTLTYTRPTAHAATFTEASDDSSIVVTWTASVLADDVFNSYVIKVRDAGVDEDSLLNEVVWRSETKADAATRIFKFPRNRSFIMSFYVRRNITLDVVDSVATSTTKTMTLLSVIVANPVTSEYVFLPLHRGRQVPWLQSPTMIPVWGREKPVGELPAQHSRVASFTALIEGPRSFQWAEYKKVESLYLNRQGVPLVYCDAFGFVFDVLMDGPVPTIPEGAWSYIEIPISLQETDAMEVY